MNYKLWLALGLLLIVGVVQWWIRLERRPSPETLAEQALSAATADDRQLAAVELAAWGDVATEQLRHVFSESDSDTVRMICVEGLGAVWDYESMGAILDAVESESPDLSGKAARAVARLTGRDYRFRANGMPAERASLVKRMRSDWEEIRSSPHFEELKRRLRESHEKSAK